MIRQKLMEFQAKCPVITFDAEVAFKNTRFRYASFPHIVKTIRPIMEDIGMGFHHTVELDETGMHLCCTVFFEEEQITSCIKLPDNSDPKTFGAALTYYKRYGLSSLLGIVTEEDKDVQGIERAKPKLSKKAYDAAQDRIAKGEQGILNKCKANFELTQKQEETLLNLELECSTS